MLLQGLRVHVLGGGVLRGEGVDGGEEEDELGGHAEGAADHGLGFGGGHGLEPGGGVEAVGERRVLERVRGLAGAREGQLRAHKEGGLGGVVDERGGDDVEDVGVDGPAEAGVVRVVYHVVVHEEHGGGESAVVVLAVADLLAERLECLGRVVELGLVEALFVGVEVFADVGCTEAQESELGAFAHVGGLEQREIGVGLCGGCAARADSVEEEVEEQLLHVASELVALRDILDQAGVCFFL